MAVKELWLMVKINTISRFEDVFSIAFSQAVLTNLAGKLYALWK